MNILTVRLAEMDLPVTRDAAIIVWKRQNNQSGAQVPGSIITAYTNDAGEATLSLDPSEVGEVYEFRIYIRGDLRFGGYFSMPAEDVYLDDLIINQGGDVPSPIFIGIRDLVNIGEGVEIFKEVVDNVAALRTLAAGSNITITIVDDQIVIGATVEKGDKGDAGADGTNGADGKSAYELALEQGFVGNITAWLASLKGDKGNKGDTGNTGAAGQSAYALAVLLGFVGTEQDWINSLKGAKGDRGDDGPAGATGPAGLQGPKGDKGNKGDDGRSAYQVAVDNGFSGSESDWLQSLIGESGITAWDMTPSTMACVYALNGDAVAAGWDGQLTTSGQRYSYQVQSGLGSDTNYGAVPQAGMSFATDSGANLAMEWEFTIPVTETAGAIDARITLVADSDPQLEIHAVSNALGRTFVILLDGEEVGTHPITNDVTIIGAEINREDGKAKIKIGDTAISLSSDVFTGNAETIMFAVVQESSTVDAANAGKEFAVRLITTGSQLSQTYPDGTVDLCGRIIGDAELTVGANSVLMVSVAGKYRGKEYGIGTVLVVQGDGVNVSEVGGDSARPPRPIDLSGGEPEDVPYPLDITQAEVEAVYPSGKVFPISSEDEQTKTFSFTGEGNAYYALQHPDRSLDLTKDFIVTLTVDVPEIELASTIGTDYEFAEINFTSKSTFTNLLTIDFQSNWRQNPPTVYGGVRFPATDPVYMEEFLTVGENVIRIERSAETAIIKVFANNNLVVETVIETIFDDLIPVVRGIDAIQIGAYAPNLGKEVSIGFKLKQPKAIGLPEDTKVGDDFYVTHGGTINGITFASPDTNGNCEGFTVAQLTPGLVLVPVRFTPSKLSNLVNDKQFVPESDIETVDTSVTATGTVTPVLGLNSSLLRLVASGAVTITNPSKAPYSGQSLEIHITSASAYAITWGSDYTAAQGLSLPTITSPTNALLLRFNWYDELANFVLTGIQLIIPEASSSMSGTIKLGADFKLSSGKLEHNTTAMTVSGVQIVYPTGQTGYIELIGAAGGVVFNPPTTTPKDGHILTIHNKRTGYTAQVATFNSVYVSESSLEMFSDISENTISKINIFQWVAGKYRLIYSSLSRDVVDAGVKSIVTNNSIRLGLSESGARVFADSPTNSASVLIGSNVRSYGKGIAIGNQIGLTSVGVVDFIGIGHSTGYAQYSVNIGWFAKAGSSGVSMGYSAGASFSGAYNTAIGTKALNTATLSWSNITGLGYNAQVTGINQLQLGDTNTDVYGQNAYNTRSDLRDKTDIKNTEFGLEFILALTPRQYRLDPRDRYRPEQPVENFPEYVPLEGLSEQEQETRRTQWQEDVYEPAKLEHDAEMAIWREACKLENIVSDGSKKGLRLHNGFIAQEVKAVADALEKDFAGLQHHQIKGGDDVMSLGYEQFIAPMVKAIQEQQYLITDLTTRLAALEG